LAYQNQSQRNSEYKENVILPTDYQNIATLLVSQQPLWADLIADIGRCNPRILSRSSGNVAQKTRFDEINQTSAGLIPANKIGEPIASGYAHTIRFMHLLKRAVG
jgi:hypothetical protein